MHEDLMNSITLEIFTEIWLPHNGLLASKLGKKVSTLLGAIQLAPIEVIRATELAEFVALHGIKKWARRLGFGSYNQFDMRGEDEAPVVSGMTFDLSAPAYFRPLLQIVDGAAKAGFFACDINLHGIVEEHEVEAFVRKCDGTAFSNNVGRVVSQTFGSALCLVATWSK